MLKTLGHDKNSQMMYKIDLRGLKYIVMYLLGHVNAFPKAHNTRRRGLFIVERSEFGIRVTP